MVTLVLRKQRLLVSSTCILTGLDIQCGVSSPKPHMLETKVKELAERLQSYDRTLSVQIDRKRYFEEGPTLTITQNKPGLVINLRFGISPFLSNDLIVKAILKSDMYRVRSIYERLKFGDIYTDQKEKEEDEARKEKLIYWLEQQGRDSKYVFFN